MSEMVVAMAGLAILNKLSASSTLFNGKLNYKKRISIKQGQTVNKQRLRQKEGLNIH